jgi:hypothetical protein
MQSNVELIPTNKCKSILQKDGSQYTDEEVTQVREFLYKLAEMDYQIFLKQKIRDQEFENEKKEIENNELKQVA